MTRRPSYAVVGKSERKVDGRGLVTGRPLFVADVDLSDALVIKMLTSPHAHANIVSIDTREAERMPGVACVLTYKNTPATRHTTAGQGFPEPSPYDARMFDTKVRYVGDRVAAVAAESEEIATRALQAIRVEYEELPAVLSIDEARRPGAPIVHDESDAKGIYDASKNIVADIDIDVGDVQAGFAESHFVVETTCETQYAQHTPIETHVVLATLDAEDRLVLRTSTQVPFHVRRIVAQTLGIPIHRIRVIKPRIGGGFGVKQEVLLEDVAGWVTLQTRRPALFSLSRPEEFTSSRTRHPMRVRVKLGVAKTGLLHAIEMEATSNTGAYGAHGLTVLANTGSKTLPLYNKAKNAHFFGQAVYTNLPVGGAYRGYGATQGYFALETAMDEAAERLGIDPIQFRLQNAIRAGEGSPIFEKLGEGREGVPQTVKSCELERCLAIGAERDRLGDVARQEGAVWAVGSRCRDVDHDAGIGDSADRHGGGDDQDERGRLVQPVDGGDRSWNRVGHDPGSDRCRGPRSAPCQDPRHVVGHGRDAVRRRGLRVVDHVRLRDGRPARGGEGARPDPRGGGAAPGRRRRIASHCAAGEVVGAGGGSVSLARVCERAMYETDQFQIGATASCVPTESPPPFLANFARVAVDTETGVVKVLHYVAAVDCGVAINPRLAEGQMEGALANGIGYALTEEMQFSSRGRVRNPTLFDYKIPGALDLPRIEVVLVDSYEPTGPMGAKSVGEIGINGPIPTIANAIYDAVGVRLCRTPFSPEVVLAALERAGSTSGLHPGD